MAAGLKGSVNPDVTTAVRAEAEGDPGSLLSLYALHESQKSLPIGGKLGADATSIVYGVNPKTGKLDCYMVTLPWRRAGTNARLVLIDLFSCLSGLPRLQARKGCARGMAVYGGEVPEVPEVPSLRLCIVHCRNLATPSSPNV